MKWMKLGDIATYINGYAFKPAQWSTKGKPIIRIQNLNNENTEYNYYDSEIDEKYIINNGDILISWSASIGAYIWERGEALLNQHIFKVKFDKIIINKNYFKYMVDIALIHSLKHMHGSTMKHLTKKVFENIIIPVPSLEEQNKIEKLLFEAQNLIDKRKEQIELLDKLTESIFYDMFGDPVVNNKNWEIDKLGKLADLINGDRSSKYPSGKEIVNDGILFVSTKNIVKNRFDLNFKQFITEEKFSELRSGKLKRDDLLITLRGTLGSCAIFNTLYDTGFINAQLMIIRCGNKLNNIFLHNLLTNLSFTRIFISLSNGAAVKQLTGKQISNLDIPVPPLSLQIKFAEKVETIEEQKKLLEKSLNLMENNYNALMQLAFNSNSL